MTTTNLFGIGLSGLNSAQIGLSTTGQNISNAATPGYTLERAEFAEASGQYTGSGYIGGGVNTTTVQRQFSQALTTELNNAQSQNSALSSYYSMVSSLNNLIGSPTTGISTSISGYFSGLQSVANNASDAPTRQTAISDAQILASQINAAGQEYDQLRESVNTQVSNTVSQVNSLTQQIAQLNTQIAAGSAGGQPPNQLLDARDTAVSSLSQLIGVQVVQNNSSYTVVMANGQPLVQGNQSYQLTTMTSPTDPSELSVGYQQPSAANPSTPVTQLLPDSSVSGGTLGGLLQFRSQTLDPAESKLGAIATSFAAQVNAQNALGIDQYGNQGGALFSVGAPTVNANPNNTGTETLSVALTNPSAPPSDNYKLAYDGSNYTLTDTTTGSVVGTSATPPSASTPIGGFALTLSGPMTAGDSFTILPTRGALNTFALATTDGGAIAASSPAIASAGGSNAGNAAISIGAASTGYAIPSSMSLSYNSTTQTLSGFPAGTSITVNTTPPQTIAIGAPTDTVPYNPSSGNTYTINSTTTPTPAGTPNGITFSLTGKPASGDTFTIAPNTGGTNDGSNAAAIANLVSSKALGGSQTLTGAYASYVNGVGNTASQLNASSSAQSTLVAQITAQQQSVSGVNLDEEATNLLQYQQLYQANSKVIQTAESLFQTLIGIFQ
jgi:flagellar hook-associated protein 1 FlgK